MTFKSNHSLMFIVFLAAGLTVSGTGKAQPADDAILISGQPQVFVDTNFNGPDPSDPFFNFFYHSAEDCIYVLGNGVEPLAGGFTFKLEGDNTLKELASCGSVTNPHPPARFYTGVASTLTGSDLPQVGGNGNSSGRLMDTNGDNTLDAVVGLLANGLGLMVDSNIGFWTPPGAANPTHIVVPHAGLRTSLSSGRFDVYIPLTQQMEVIVTNSATGATLGSLDFTNGVTLGGQSFNTLEIFMLGQPAAIPALAPWGIVLLMLTLVGIFVFGLRRFDLPRVSP